MHAEVMSLLISVPDLNKYTLREAAKVYSARKW